MKKHAADVWVREGLTVLAEMGPDGLTIDELCRRLNLTKGSFYHHYANRSMYIKALLEFPTNCATRWGDLESCP